MSTSAAVRGLLQIPRAGPAFRGAEADEDAVAQFAWEARIQNIRNILSQGGHTITQLSAATRQRYGIRSPHFIPATFLYKLRSGVMPHVCQIVALSESTGYRFVDWLRMFGFDLQQIPRLQMLLHSERTVLITPVEDGFEPLRRPDSFSGYFFSDNSFGGHSFKGRNPSDHGCSDEGWWRSFRDDHTGEWNSGGRYLFAKIGNRDALAFPGIVPGDIVRVERYYAHRVRGLNRASANHLLWLVEHSDGLTCCPVRWIDDRQIVLLPSRPPWGCWPLRMPVEARILGLVTAQARPRVKQFFPQDLSSRDQFPPQFPPECFSRDDRKEDGSRGGEDHKEERMKFSDLLRSSRGRTGMTFRAAQRLTRSIAQMLGNREHTIALGLLSDYEAMGNLPRHIAKILSLCIVYCIDIWKLMEAAGVYVDDSAKLPLPVPDFNRSTYSDVLGHAMTHEVADVVASYAQSAGG